MKEKTKILLDTDAGDDIDDALAIALGLSCEEVEFVGITTTYKNTNDRARLVKKLVMGSGRDIPVYAGHCGGLVKPVDAYAYPYLGADGKAHMCQYTDDLASAEYAPINDAEGIRGDAAIDFIIDSCHRYGKELTVLAIGPLTNIAKVIEKDPTALNAAKRVVIMGGSFFRTDPEWNIICDLEAADVLFGGKVNNLECIGLDVTLKTTLTEAEAARVTGYNGSREYSRYASGLVDLWMKRNDGTPTLHDPLALYYCIFPDVVNMCEMQVKVIADGQGAGITADVGHWQHWLKNKLPHYAVVKVARSVDRDRFVPDFIDRVFGK